MSVSKRLSGRVFGFSIGMAAVALFTDMQLQYVLHGWIGGVVMCGLDAYERRREGEPVTGQKETTR